MSGRIRAAGSQYRRGPRCPGIIQERHTGGIHKRSEGLQAQSRSEGIQAQTQAFGRPMTVGRLEGLKVERLEGWEVGRLGGWKVGRVEGWLVVGAANGAVVPAGRSIFRRQVS